MNKGIGLCGSHRTGKTTLARQISLKTGMDFLQTSTSEVFLKNGLSPSEYMDFATRIMIQHKVLQAAEAVWKVSSSPFITDRTPIDMMAYTLADIQGSTIVEFDELESYLDRCFAVTNMYFSSLYVVQPAIPLVHEDGKAALNKGYMEHLNVLIKGLCSDDRVHVPVRVIPRSITDMTLRITEIVK